MREMGSTQRKKGSGRPRKTTPVEDHFLILQCRRNRFKTSSDIRGDLERATGKQISASLVRKRLVKAGLRALKPVQKPEFTLRVKKKRLLWAQEHVSWTQEMWNGVIFSDESKFKLHVGDGRILVRREPRERLSNECLLRLPPKNEGVMVWGCFSGNETGRLCFVSSKITAAVYLQVLHNEFEPSVLKLFGETCRFIFQQDNAPCHTAKVVKKYFAEKSIDVLSWPPYSPDLNPIENIWSIMKLEVARKRPESIQALKSLLMTIWESIPSTTLKNLSNSMNQRCIAVIKAKGGPTKY